MPTDIFNSIPTYESVNLNFTFDPQASVDTMKQEIKNIYKIDPPISRSEIRNIVGSHISHQDRFVRSSGEQAEARRLNAQMQENIANEFVARKGVMHTMEEKFEGCGKNLGRSTIFFRLEGGEAADKFNEDFAKAAQANDRRAMADLMYQEIERAREKLNIKTNADIIRLYNASDRQLAEQYADIKRFVQLAAEAYDGDAKDADFTPEQRAQVNLFHGTVDVIPALTQRCDLVANPLYVEYDPARLYGKGLNSAELQNSVEQLGTDALGRNSASKHPVTAFFSLQDTYRTMQLPGFMSRVEAAEPALKGATLSADLMMSFYANKPVIAYGQDGQQYVVTDSMFVNKIPTVEEYTQKLSDAAEKADRFLLTGSRQFANMQRAMGALKEAQNEEMSTEEQAKRAEALKNATLAYLSYKHVDLENYTGHASLHGKNKREQSRLETAANFLDYAQAQIQMLGMVPELEKQMAEKAKVQKELEENATRQINRTQTLLGTGERVIANANKVVSRAVPQDATVVETKQEDGTVKKRTVRTPKMEQGDFDALCALATGSGEVTYKSMQYDLDSNGQYQLENGKRKTKINENTHIENPEQTFDQTIDSIVGAKKQDELPKDLRNNVAGAASFVFHCVDNKNYQSLGKALADGMMQNNRLMAGQMGFNPKFRACARLNEKALQLMEKYPDLGKQVEQILPADQLQTAKSAQALYNMYKEGLQAQDSLISRLRSPDKDKAYDGIENDVAKVCHMYGAENNFAGKTLKLNEIDPAKYPEHVKNVTGALAKDPNILNFVGDLKNKPLAQQVIDAANPRKMSALFADTAVAAQQQIQQNQPKPQLQMQIQQPQQQIQQPPQPQNPVSAPF